MINKLALSALISAATLSNPTTPKTLSFDASAYVTTNNQIRVAVSKTAQIPVVILLRDDANQVIYRQNINKNDAKYAVKLNVAELADGKYELEVQSSEGSIRKQLNLSTQPAQQISRVVAMQ
ncbi:MULTISPECIES: hypothetical protein [Spirosoma]|uniref:DUF3244 domain-containing protein n=1 Tax=Spirosoma liriopis TaxID=2937440 RepID=A0ABT0HQ15_9BACT|nr:MULTISPECIES: hypothetical protein [Spirosoma]MCK8493942.1 hypothetical protein [Spirosoma liriopis]UHG93591.1 hypothetical protein LQ777_11950 [Spirosoma oryzicola]